VIDRGICGPRAHLIDRRGGLFLRKKIPQVMDIVLLSQW